MQTRVTVGDVQIQEDRSAAPPADMALNHGTFDPVLSPSPRQVAIPSVRRKRAATPRRSTPEPGVPVRSTLSPPLMSCSSCSSSGLGARRAGRSASERAPAPRPG